MKEKEEPMTEDFNKLPEIIKSEIRGIEREKRTSGQTLIISLALMLVTLVGCLWYPDGYVISAVAKTVMLGFALVFYGVALFAIREVQEYERDIEGLFEEYGETSD